MKTEITDALIYFSNCCNLDCSYCFVPKETEKRLSWEQIEAFFTWFLKQPARLKRIGIAGGEPLLELGLIKKTFSFLREAFTIYLFDSSTDYVWAFVGNKIFIFCRLNHLHFFQ